MSWAITVNDIDKIEELPDTLYDMACRENPDYYGDANAAFNLAKQAGLVSATISGGRTPSPYGGPDTVVVSIIGFDNRNEGHAVPPIAARDFNSTVLRNIMEGPDDEDADGEGNERDVRGEAYPDSRWSPAIGGID
jgi:hypothetical protein